MKTQEKRSLLYGFLLGSVTILMVAAWHLSLRPAASAAPKALPRAVVIATHRVGTRFHADGSGIAKLVSERSPMTMVVRPHPGPPAWLPAMNTGEIEFGVITGADAAAAYKGVGAYRKAFPNIRLLIIGAPLRVAFWARVDSGIRTVADLRGKRVPSGWSGLPVIHFNAGANLATAGLTWDDVVRVPVAELAEDLRAFLEGRTDVLWHSVGSPAVEEANARIRGGVRLVAIGTAPEGLKRMGEINPGTYMTVVKKGSASAVLEDTPVQTNDVYITTPVLLRENVAYATVKVLWDYNKELVKISPRLRPWTRGRMVSTEAAIPYHPGAIRFFREKGVWPAGMEALQQRLLQR
ncbi:MAG: TAXI family TRAP transporter solute-binding subunit [Candidatus Methylomirabilales bacterium]